MFRVQRKIAGISAKEKYGLSAEKFANSKK
jgi:hypothetical protein